MYAPWIRKFNSTLNAITLWKWVLYAEKNPSAVLINHERIHLDQIKKEGVVVFYFTYLYQYVVARLSGMSHYNSYMNISFEVEAYTNQENLKYEVRR